MRLKTSDKEKEVGNVKDSLKAKGWLSSSAGTLILVFVFFALNITFNAYNKFLFSTVAKNGAGFQVPVLATITHAFAGFLCASIMTLFPSVYVRKRIPDTQMWLTIIGIAIFFSGSIGLNNSSLQFLALSMQQIIRSSAPAVVAICSFLLEGKQFTWKQIASLTFLVGGVSLAVFGDSQGTEPIGVILCFGSVLGTAMQYTFVSITMNPENRLKSFDLLLYTGIPTIIVLLPAVLLNGEPKKLADYVGLNGASKAIGYILIGQALAISYNLTVFTFIHSMSAVYVTVCGVFKVVLVIAFSVIVLGDEINPINATGLAIALCAFGANSYFEFERRKTNDAKRKHSDTDEESLLGQKQSSTTQ